MSGHSTNPSSVCPDCGGPKYRYARYCNRCKGKGDRNPRYGKGHSEGTREKIRQAALQRARKPRRQKAPSTTKQAGREFAVRWFPLPELCERCKAAPPCDRHHVDGNPCNNHPSNVQFLCRRCHQETDGRIEMLRRMNAARRAATHCQRGHPREPGKCCRVCQRAAEQRSRAKKRALARRLLAAEAPLFGPIE